MNTENKTWQGIKTSYLKQVKEALQTVGHPRSKEVIDDVCSHLDQRFAELEPQQQTWENYQAIITEMDPASDYAELLGSDQTTSEKNISYKFLVLLGLISTGILLTMIILPKYIQRKEQQNETSDRNELSFDDDPRLIGDWQSIDFVNSLEVFSPSKKFWRGDLFLKNITFRPRGKTSMSFTWTKGWLRCADAKAQYYLQEIEGSEYLFMPRLSGDVTIRGRKPGYYVLVKKEQAAKKTQQKDTSDAETKAVQVALDWLKLLDQHEYGRSWDEAASFFRQALPRDRWINTMEALQKPLGGVISRNVMSKQYLTSLPGAPDGEYVVMQFNTSFENKKSAVETVTPMREKDGIWRVSGYYIK